MIKSVVLPSRKKPENSRTLKKKHLFLADPERTLFKSLGIVTYQDNQRKHIQTVYITAALTIFSQLLLRQIFLER